jgi:pyruvate kinase
VITLFTGDRLVLTRELTPGRNARVNDAGMTEPAHIGCTLPEVFISARKGERIWFDDGKIGGIIRRVDENEIDVEITRARASGSRLREEKGINLPDTDLALDPLTDKDLADLEFVAANADIVGLSFVGKGSDVESLRNHLHELGPRRPGIVLKIETRRAFEQLPELILEAMGDPSAGIMIARGDLAVETGFERLAEVQEEILWIAEAAHLPVIWATQVLETLAKTGVPSRSEITDAAMGQRAECVMLNKGPHVVEAIDLLDGILRRMTAHQLKKRSLLRQLRSWSPDLR